MWYRHLLAFAILFPIAPAAHAQVGPSGMDPSQYGNVHVRVIYPNDRSAGFHLRVQLVGGGSTPVAENFTNDQGVADFNRVPIGVYHVLVKGENIEAADSGEFEVDRRKMSQDLYITVHDSAPASSQAVGGPPSVAAVDLNIPSAAQKEFDQASKAMASQDWAKAIQRLKRAISIYPQYAPAYNNMGVAFGHMNDPEHEREALEKAVSLNDHFVSAFVNLAKMSLREHDSPRAETLLESAVRADPTNLESMTLLAESQLLNKHYDAAIATARDVHRMLHQHSAVVHYIAARAFEHQNRLQDALVELRMFLTEEPAGARADQVRKEITQIEHQAAP